MQKQQQTNKPQIINGQKFQLLQPQISEMTRTFSNPICKQTYNSLPKIYGKKKKIKLNTSPSKQGPQPDDNNRTKTRKYFSSGQSNAYSKVRRKQQGSKSVKLSEQLHQCHKKSCSVHIYAQAQRKTRSKFSESQFRRIILPQIRKFQLEDLQSQHKVSLQGIFNRTNHGMTGLQKIIQENQKRSKQNSPRNSQENSKRENNKNIKDLISNKASGFNAIKNRHKFKPTINNAKFEIEQQSDQQKRTQQDANEQSKGKRLPKNNSRYQTEVNDSQSPKSSNSISLTSLVFQGSKRQNTNFFQLNKSQKYMEKKMSRKPSQLSNGLFRIPEQPEYEQYLKGYNNVNQKFNIKNIAKRPRFSIQKHEKGVYFGQLDEQLRKHGQGINVTEREIFQGRYDRDVKTSGSQRNIDGVYIGEFKNGQRSGHGIFKWNNGEIFQGQWENGMKNGHGIWKSPKGDYYQGQWVQNRQHGQGVFKHRTSTYKGQFKNFLKDGQGQQLFANGDKYVGSYKQGKPDGKGRYTWFKGGYYEGQFHLGMREGYGKWVDEHGTFYEGNFLNILVQAILNQILSMDLQSSIMLRGRGMKANFMRELGPRENFMIRTIILLKSMEHELILNDLKQNFNFCEKYKSYSNFPNPYL